jgi:nicotinamidase-related amidase
MSGNSKERLGGRAAGPGKPSRARKELCAALLVDVQDFFLRALPPAERTRIKETTAQMVGLFSHLGCPVLATLERPVDAKGTLPSTILAYAKAPPVIFEKDFFDLSREKEIEEGIAALGRRQLVLAGGETDVCLLQSCLGLLEAGYEVFVVEDLVFSSSGETDAAVRRMRGAGAVVLTYKTLFHELLQAVEGSEPRRAIAGPGFPKELDGFSF